MCKRLSLSTVCQSELLLPHTHTKTSESSRFPPALSYAHQCADLRLEAFTCRFLSCCSSLQRSSYGFTSRLLEMSVLVTDLSATLNWHRSWHSSNMTEEEEKGSRYGHLGSEAEGSQMRPSWKKKKRERFFSGAHGTLVALCLYSLRWCRIHVCI